VAASFNKGVPTLFTLDFNLRELFFFLKPARAGVYGEQRDFKAGSKHFSI